LADCKGKCQNPLSGGYAARWRLDSVEATFKGACQITARGTGGPRTGQNDHIDRWKLALAPPEDLPELALHAIALHRPAQVFFSDRQAQPGPRKAIGAPQDEEQSVATLTRPVEDTLKIPAREEAILLGEGGIQGRGPQTASRARPFALRALITLRPLCVAIRARKPCVLARFRRLG